VRSDVIWITSPSKEADAQGGAFIFFEVFFGVLDIPLSLTADTIILPYDLCVVSGGGNTNSKAPPRLLNNIRQARLAGADAIIEIQERFSTVAETKVYHVIRHGNPLHRCPVKA
jgi:hypothetical protein